MITIRIVRWSKNFTKAEHQDIDVSDMVYWEPPGGGWQVVAISMTEKGLPPWDGATDTPERSNEVTYGDLRWTRESWMDRFGDMMGFPSNEPNTPDGEVHKWHYYLECGHSRVIERNYTPKRSGYSIQCNADWHKNGPVLRNVIDVIQEELVP